MSQTRKVSDLIKEIGSATNEQRRGVDPIGTAVTHLDHVTQQNAALVEQSAAAAESLNQQAQKLVDVVAAFNLAGAAETV